MAHPDRAANSTLPAGACDACEFHEFVQWIADRQLHACQDARAGYGMPIGLYIDLAVGIDPHGADAWSEQDAVLADVSIGAPPDEFNPAGQDWGLAPFNPQALAPRTISRRCADLLRAAMRHAGAIRLDHVLGLKRLFMIPRGCGAADGAYVRFPFEQLLRVIAEESNAHRCIVIGEDLGTVPEGFRETMARWGLWTYRVMLFERERDGRFRAAGSLSGGGAGDLQHARFADLPRLDGRPRSARQARHRARSRRKRRCARAGRSRAARRAVASAAPSYPPDDFAAVAAFLARHAVAAGGDRARRYAGRASTRSTCPAPSTQHPNWRRKLPVALEDLAGHDGLATRRAGVRAGRARLQRLNSGDRHVPDIARVFADGAVGRKPAMRAVLRMLERHQSAGRLPQPVDLRAARPNRRRNRPPP